jgi:spore germination cell wall hydrolase CwlJ-like protein
MATIIKPKRSETADSVPSSGDLAVGEIAVNPTDKKIYVKKADGTVVDMNPGVTASDTDTTQAVSKFTFADTTSGNMFVDFDTESGTAIVKVAINADQDYGLITQAVGDYNALDYGSL